MLNRKLKIIIAVGLVGVTVATVSTVGVVVGVKKETTQSDGVFFDSNNERTNGIVNADEKNTGSFDPEIRHPNRQDPNKPVINETELIPEESLKPLPEPEVKPAQPVAEPEPKEPVEVVVVKPEEPKPQPEAPKEEHKEPEKPVEEEKQPEPEPAPAAPSPTPDPVPAPEPEPQPVPAPPSPKPPVVTTNPGTTSNGKFGKIMTQAELIESLRDKGESAAATEGNKFTGGVGTPSRQEGLPDTPTSDMPLVDKWSMNPGGQDSALVLSKLIRNGVTLDNLPKLTEPVDLATLKTLRANSLRYTGKKILNLTGADLKDMLKYYNENLLVHSTASGQPLRLTMSQIQDLIKKKKERPNELTTLDRQNIDWINMNLDPKSNFVRANITGILSIDQIKPKTSFTNEEIDYLEKGDVPQEINHDGTITVWTKQAQFVNDVVFTIAANNMKRFLPMESVWERSHNSIMNLDFRAWDKEKTNSGFTFNKVNIPGYDPSVVFLREYENVRSKSDADKRYIFEVLKPHKIDDINNVIKAADDAKLLKNHNSGLGISLRNINASSGEYVAKIVREMPANTKSLTMFYDWDDPKAIHALIDNKNFGVGKNSLYELNLYTDTATKLDDKRPGAEAANILSRIDPRIYQLVDPGAYDYKYNAIFLTMAIRKPEKNETIAETMNYVYNVANNRRELQGYWGGQGGYPVMWDFRDANRYDINNVQIPFISNFGQGFSRLTYSTVINNQIIMNLRDLKIDNSDKVRYEYGNPTLGNHYAHTASSMEMDGTNIYLRILGTSSRGTAADVTTINNTVNRSWMYIRHLDLSDQKDTRGNVYKTKFTEEIIKKTAWSVWLKTITLNGKVYQAGKDYQATVQ